MKINQGLLEASMTADIDNLILEHLRALRADVSDVKERLTQVEIRLATLSQEVVALAAVVDPRQCSPVI
jgi:hypothetical protein